MLIVGVMSDGGCGVIVVSVWMLMAGCVVVGKMYLLAGPMAVATDKHVLKQCPVHLYRLADISARRGINGVLLIVGTAAYFKGCSIIFFHSKNIEVGHSVLLLLY